MTGLLAVKEGLAGELLVLNDSTSHLNSALSSLTQPFSQQNEDH
jgi:hypothetical protein